MPSPVSAVKIAAFGYVALTAYARGGSAVSPEAGVGASAAKLLVYSAERSHVLFGGRIAALSQLYEVALECSAAGWDGLDASPVSAISIVNASNLIRSIPAEFPLPEIAADPDGEIALDWMLSRTRMLSISVGETSRLSYSWLDGTDQGYAVAKFDGQHFPTRIEKNLGVLLDHAQFRSA